MGAERDRVADFGKPENGLRQAGDWYRWGPYVSERQWGTVREDYSADGDAWNYLPHDHARSRAYRWGEDGLAGAAPVTPYPKAGINDHVIGGAPTVNPARTGTKCAFWYRVTLAGGASAELRLRLRPASSGIAAAAAPEPGVAAAALGREFDLMVARRRAEADEFYDELTPRDATDDEAMVMRQAFAGLLRSKQLFYYDVAQWLDGDPGQPAPPPQRLTGRNSHWRNFDAFDIMSMPDKWEYPWFAAWDLAFHCVALAHVDPAFAKYQLILLCRVWFQHPSGTLPAYEWNFSDVNPPVQAWVALEVFAGRRRPRPRVPLESTFTATTPRRSAPRTRPAGPD